MRLPKSPPYRRHIPLYLDEPNDQLPGRFSFTRIHETWKIFEETGKIE